MAIFTGQFPQGNCRVFSVQGNTVDCEPVIEDIFFTGGPIINDWHSWHAKVTGEIGECVCVNVHWPRAAAENEQSDVYKAWNIGAWQPKSIHDFAKYFFYISYDHLHWKKIETVKTDGQCITFHFTLERPECYLSSSLLYTVKMLENLLSACEGNPYATRIPLCRGAFGDPVHLLRIAEPGEDDQAKKHIYFEAALHCGETTACFLMDAAIRFLTSGSAAARALLRAHVFHIVPVADVSGWRLGRQTGTCTNKVRNMNRDWGEFASDVTRSIWAYLSTLQSSGREVSLAIDYHGGWPDTKGSARTGSWVGVWDVDHPQMKAALNSVALSLTECGFLAPGAIHHTNEPESTQTRGFLNAHGIPTLLVECAYAVAYCKETSEQAQLSQALLKQQGEAIPAAVCEGLART